MRSGRYDYGRLVERGELGVVARQAQNVRAGGAEGSRGDGAVGVREGDGTGAGDLRPRYFEHAADGKSVVGRHAVLCRRFEEGHRLIRTGVDDRRGVLRQRDCAVVADGEARVVRSQRRRIYLRRRNGRWWRVSGVGEGTVTGPKLSSTLWQRVSMAAVIGRVRSYGLRSAGAELVRPGIDGRRFLGVDSTMVSSAR